MVVVNQGGSAYDVGVGASNFGINGSPFTVQWPDATAPTATANQRDVYSFTIVNTSTSAGSPAWQVFGSKSSFA